MTTIPYSKPRTKADVVRESFAHPANNTYYFSHLSNPTAYNSSLIYLMSQRQQGGGMGMGMAGMGMMNPMMMGMGGPMMGGMGGMGMMNPMMGMGGIGMMNPMMGMGGYGMLGGGLGSGAYGVDAEVSPRRVSHFKSLVFFLRARPSLAKSPRLFGDYGMGMGAMPGGMMGGMGTMMGGYGMNMGMPWGY
ncbi:hypothetical protein C349_02017 [Cryptococcus neoformans var. grubii Br795]|nr:hypothetical protein C349_02022 [Cryptococcus neoformans var. grubii Br795]OXG86416.1 hypothetical protein C349_02017 [Cryptococcus neoformans var. grubii Br795]